MSREIEGFEYIGMAPFTDGYELHSFRAKLSDVAYPVHVTINQAPGTVPNAMAAYEQFMRYDEEIDKENHRRLNVPWSAK